MWMNVVYSCTHLRDDGEPTPEIMEPQGGDVNTVDDDSTFTGFNDAKQAVGQTRFACTRSTNDANLGKVREQEKIYI